LIDEAVNSVGPLWKGSSRYSHYCLGNRIADIRETVNEIAMRQVASAGSSTSPRTAK